jgi:hypothetical protein
MPDPYSERIVATNQTYDRNPISTQYDSSYVSQKENVFLHNQLDHGDT